MNKRWAQIGLPVAGAIIGGLGWYGWSTSESLEAERASFAQKEQEHQRTIGEFEYNLSKALEERDSLQEELKEEQRRVDRLAREFDDVSDTVGDLEKLSKTDPELLQKYSKIYFLNEHYIPPRLTVIDEEFWFQPEKTLEIHSEVYPHLKDMLEDAADDDIDLEIVSAYRSYGTQAALKSSYRVTYGSGANQFSADQGYSEHQLGTTIDLTTPEVGGSFVGFEDTEAYDWLLDNAYRYGFILSYPPNNAYYQYEPWHWRYVGEDLARHLHNEGLSFYDVDQREIDKYLISIFD